MMLIMMIRISYKKDGMLQTMEIPCLHILMDVVSGQTSPVVTSTYASTMVTVSFALDCFLSLCLGLSLFLWQIVLDQLPDQEPDVL